MAIPIINNNFCVVPQKYEQKKEYFAHFFFQFQKKHVDNNNYNVQNY